MPPGTKTYLSVNGTDVQFQFFFSSRRRHTRFSRDWSSDVCSSDLGVARAPAAVARGQVKPPAVHRTANEAPAPFRSFFECPPDQRPLAVGTRIVQSVELPLVTEQRDADAVHLDELARAVRDLGDLCQKNHAAYPQSLTIAVVTGWLYALYLSRVSSPSQVRSRFVSIPGKSGHPCSHLCLRIHSSPRSIARSHCARMPRTLQTSMMDRVQSMVWSTFSPSQDPSAACTESSFITPFRQHSRTLNSSPRSRSATMESWIRCAVISTPVGWNSGSYQPPSAACRSNTNFIPLRQEALTLARVGSSTRCLPTASSTSKKLIGWLTASRSAQDGSDHFPSTFWVSRKYLAHFLTASAIRGCFKERFPRISIRAQNAVTHAALSLLEDIFPHPPSACWQSTSARYSDRCCGVVFMWSSTRSACATSSRS